MIRAATPDDAAALGDIGPRAYAAAYGGWWRDPAALAAHAESFGAAAFSALIDDPAVSVWLAEARPGSPVGFLTLHHHQPNPVDGRLRGAELRRLYLLPEATRQGTGRRLAEAAIASARTLGHDHLWLDVMAAAPWAVDAYRSWGFAEIGRINFHNALRGDWREMIVMMRAI